MSSDPSSVFSPGGIHLRQAKNKSAFASQKDPLFALYMCSIAPRTHAKQPSSLAKQKALKVTRADAELAVPAPRCWKRTRQERPPSRGASPNLPRHKCSWSSALRRPAAHEMLLEKTHGRLLALETARTRGAANAPRSFSLSSLLLEPDSSLRQQTPSLQGTMWGCSPRAPLQGMRASWWR